MGWTPPAKQTFEKKIMSSQHFCNSVGLGRGQAGSLVCSGKEGAASGSLAHGALPQLSVPG